MQKGNNSSAARESKKGFKNAKQIVGKLVTPSASKSPHTLGVPIASDLPLDELPPREQLRLLLHAVKAVRSGDFSVRMPLEQEGIIAEIGEVLNDIIEINENMANEFVRVRSTVGQEGRMAERVSIGSVKGAWATNEQPGIELNKPGS